MRPRIINAILISVSILLWLVLLGFHLGQHVAGNFPSAQIPFRVGDFWFHLTLVGFFLTNALLIERLFSHIEKLHVTTLLWRLFMIGMIGITVIMLVTFANKGTQELNTHPYLTAIYFSLAFYATVVFFLSGVFIFRRFILYPRTQRKLWLWRIFLGLLGVSFLLTFAPDSRFWNAFSLGSYVPFLIVTLLLSTNVRWIAYLNFNQKLRALGLFMLLLVVLATYLIAMILLPEQLQIEFMGNLIFMRMIILFTLIYSGFSILVLFFNLPTSSIFEMQRVEIASFSKINQAIQSNLDFTEIMHTLLDAAMLAGNTRSGWVELIDEESGESVIQFQKKISRTDIKSLKQSYNLTEKVLRDQSFYLVRNTRKHKAFRSNDSRYRCLLAVPIISSSKTFGTVCIANELVNSFEDEAIQSITSFAEQAGIALENAQLVRSSIELERYQEQLKIAKEVQRRLLPSQLPFSEQLEFAALSENAQEVGGDYFDVVQPQEDIYRVAIGDVSGKGTTAAFYMAETKGIFHALTQLDLSVKDFLVAANRALSACLQQGSFVTLTYLQIDLKRKQLEMIRAGHCPAFYYKKSCDEVQMLREGTLGLAILRNGSFGDYVAEPERISFEAGDLLVLYTDGIMEARNQAGEEFGYDRLQKLIERHKHAPTAQLVEEIVFAAKTFTDRELQDDYTVLIIRFK